MLIKLDVKGSQETSLLGEREQFAYLGLDTGQTSQLALPKMNKGGLYQLDI